MESLLSKLNSQQRLAVLHGEEPLLVLAGAGTGKTATLAHRVACLVEQGAHPARILLLTFTRRAASEMLRRVEVMLQVSGSGSSSQGRAGQLWGGTFHAVASRLLRLHGRSIGLAPAFTIMDRADAEDVLNLLRVELGLALRDKRFPLKATCLDIYTRTVNAREPLDYVLERRFPWCRDHAADLRELFLAYVARKEAQDVLDYDDLLVFWHGLLRHPEGGRALRERFDWVLVDEYQDTNSLQAEILASLCPGGRGLTVVGDDAQSIYSFRSATVRNILDFPRDFPQARVLTLEETYRAHNLLLEPANRVLAEAAEAYPKRLWSQKPPAEPPELITCSDEEEQADIVIRQILDHRERGIPLHKQAVLFRAAHHSLALELELTRRNVPFRKYGGLKFLEAAHVKDLLAFLRLAENPRDQAAGMRVLMLLPGIGPQRAQAALEVISGEDGPSTARDSSPPWEALASPAGAEQCWPAFVELMAELSDPRPPSPSAQIDAVKTFYAPLLFRRHDHPEARLQDLESLAAYGSRFAERATFLAELTLDPPSFTGELAGPPALDEDYLVLSTIHSAKGLEWEAVYVIHAADGNLPSDMACRSEDEIEEERRLFYVALTRAKESLYVLVPLRYYTVPRTPFDRHGFAQPSRFLSPNVRSSFRERSGPRLHSQREVEEGEGVMAPGTAAEIRDSLRSLW